jgi:polyketide biosynthesis enoyl-CoA hydratase PksH
MSTIKRLTLEPRLIVSIVDGRAMAGGIGLVAASDWVIATPRSQFSLSEALWGLLPAMVAPYLIRRVGFQTAFRMTLTTLPISAQEAWTAHLVDEVSEHPLDNLRRLWLRVSKLETATVKNVKAYFREMWLISEQMEELAVAETNRLAADPVVIRNITDYIEFQKFPWDEK